MKLPTMLAIAALTASAARAAGPDAHDRAARDAQRAAALLRMARSGQPSVEYFLVIGASDGSPLVRQTAVRSIATVLHRPGANARAALRAALADAHPLVVLAAVQALHVHPDPEAAGALSRIVRRPPPCRLEHELPLSAVGQTRTTRWEIASEAFRALERTGWRQDADAVLNVLAARDPAARLAAARALEQLAGKLSSAQRAAAVAGLADALAGRSVRVRRAVAAALARFGDARGTGVLIDQLRHPDARDGGWLRAVRALERLTGQDWRGSDEQLWRAPAERPSAEIARRLKQIEAHLRSKHHPTEPPQVVPSKLTPSDRASLDGLFELGLLDPRGARFVSFSYPRRTVWAGSATVREHGWRVPATDRRQPAVLGPWGRRLASAANVQAVPFDDAARKLSHVPDGLAAGAAARRCLTSAAWAHRLGREALSAGLLFTARERAYDDEELIAAFRREAARELLLDAVHAYMVRADAEALAAVTRAVRAGERYADAFGPAAELLAELKRRKAAGTFGKAPRPLPDALSDRPVARRVEWLIAGLDDVDVRQRTQPGGIDLTADPRVRALIEIGEPALPALIDCIERDRRLTRCVHFQRDFLPYRSVLAVREAALFAAQSILRKPFFVPAGPADNFTRRGPAAAAAMARRLRDYWNAHGKLPLAQRMMKVLTGETSQGRELRLAAESLATLGRRAVFGTTIGTTRLLPGEDGPSPAAETFTDPTAAEATLAAMQRDLKAFDTTHPEPSAALRASRRRIENVYLSALAHLGDRRIVGRLLGRYRQAGALGTKCKFAAACLRLGDAKAMRQFAQGFRAGTLPLAQQGRAAERLREAVRCLAATGESGDEALFALAAPEHPWHATVREAVRRARLDDADEAAWFAHPYCLRILRAELRRTEPTGTVYAIEDGALVVRAAGGTERLAIPELLARPEARKAGAAERICDAVARRVAELVFGSPRYHPLRKDADARRRRTGELLQRFEMRAMTAAERAALGVDAPHAVFLPDVRAPGRPATPGDVDAGRAIFHLGGTGQLAPGWKPPAIAVWTSRKAGREPQRVLVVQAEACPNGSVRCGILAPHAVADVDPNELADVRALPSGQVPARGPSRR